MIEAIVVSVASECKSEIEKLNLDLEKLLEVVRYADSERALCTRNDPRGFGLITINAKAARGLREQFCGNDWVHDETDNQPGILNEELGVRIIPCNFDENAGNPLLDPTNRTEKGAASSKKVRCNGTSWLPGLEPPIIDDESGVVTLVLGIFSEEAEPLRAELSYPLEFNGGKYKYFKRRIMLLSGSDAPIDSPATADSESGKPTETVEINVERRKK